MADEVLFTAAGAGRPLDPGGTIRCRVSSRQTGGLYTIIELDLPPGGGPPFHVHQHEDEIFYIMEGECLIGTQQGQHTARAGDTVVFPRGVIHSFKNESSAPARILITAIPGGLDEYFEEIAAAVSGDQAGRVAEINQKFAIDFNPSASTGA